LRDLKTDLHLQETCPATEYYQLLYYTLHYTRISTLYRNAVCVSNKKTVVEQY